MPDMTEPSTLEPDPRHLHPLPLEGGELVLVRHGESTANAAGIGQGRAEFPLSERGMEQARLTARFLQDIGPVDLLVSSPQQRAFQTAEAIGEVLGLAVGTDAGLVEIDIGVLSGNSWDALEASHPAEMAAYRAAEAARPHPRNRELIPGWEPIPAVVARVWQAIARASATRPRGRVVVVAHGGVLNAFLTHLLAGDARETPWRHPSTNCAISRIELLPEGPRAACLTDDGHLAAMATGRPVFDPVHTQAP